MYKAGTIHRGPLYKAIASLIGFQGSDADLKVWEDGRAFKFNAEGPTQYYFWDVGDGGAVVVELVSHEVWRDHGDTHFIMMNSKLIWDAFERGLDEPGKAAMLRIFQGMNNTKSRDLILNPDVRKSAALLAVELAVKVWPRKVCQCGSESCS